MRALTILQPWASLIVEGTLDEEGRPILKDIENRNWPTRYRGRIAIHAGVRKESWQFQMASALCSQNDWNPPGLPVMYPGGFILGTARLVDCVTRHPSCWFSVPYGFVLTEIQRFSKPVLARGALGLWEWRQSAQTANLMVDADDR